jgi:hypothetical protein
MSNKQLDSYGITVNDMDNIKAKLSEWNGKYWELALGELQLQYGEACIWILLQDKKDSRRALNFFRDLLRPFQQKWPLIKFTVSFNAHEGDTALWIDFLEGNDIQSDAKLKMIGSNIIVEPIEDNDIFINHKKRHQ